MPVLFLIFLFVGCFWTRGLRGHGRLIHAEANVSTVGKTLSAFPHCITEAEALSVTRVHEALCELKGSLPSFMIPKWVPRSRLTLSARLGALSWILKGALCPPPMLDPSSGLSNFGTIDIWWQTLLRCGAVLRLWDI